MKRPAPFFSIFCALFSALPVCAQRVELEEPKNHGGFFGFAFAPDGTIVAGGTGTVSLKYGAKAEVFGGEVIFWDAKTGRIRRTLGGHDAGVQCIMFSANGAVLVSGSEKNGIVKLWDGKSGALRHTLKLGNPLGEGPSGVTSLCAVSPDGKSLATVAVTEKSLGKSTVREGDRLVVWETSTGRPRWELPNSNVDSLTFTDDGTALVAFTEKTEWSQSGDGVTGKHSDHRLVGWEVGSGKERFRNETMKSSPLLLTTLPRAGIVMLARGNLVFIDERTGQTAKKTKLQSSEQFFSFTFSPDQKRFVAARFMGEAVYWFDLENGRRVATQELKPSVWHAAFSADLKRMVCDQAHKRIVVDLQPVAVESP